MHTLVSARPVAGLDDLAAAGFGFALGGLVLLPLAAAFGGIGFTPIVNHPEVAILGLSRSRMEPEWIQDKDAGKFEPRLILPLSLSYDHRLIDGADAARFLRWIAEAFEQPFLLSVQG